MNILVIGCGKIGSRLANLLSDEGHDVSIVDSIEENFDLLDDNFSGFTTIGVPIDQDVLKKAGIENCDAIAAVSSDDNVNIMVCQVAKEFFNIKNVVARIYDPKREDIFSHFDIHTVCPTNLTVSSIRNTLIDNEKVQKINIDCHSIDFNTIEIPKNLIGLETKDLKLKENQTLFAVLHSNYSLTLIYQNSIKLKLGDKLIISNLVD